MLSERSARGSKAPAILLLAGVVLGLVAYYRVASGALNLTTGLLLIGAVWVGLFLLVELASMARPIAAYRNRLRLLAITVGVLALGSELFLRFSDPSLRTYFEQNGETAYRSLSQSTGPMWFHVYSANIDMTRTTADFVYTRHTNDLGLSERNIAREKTEREYRIIALGDSFTEGVGVDYQSSWVKVMERKLADKLPGRVVTAMNAGISGSDIFFEYILLKEKLAEYAPDLVLVAVNTSDVQDVVLRGGMERFQPDGTYRSPRQPPWWEWLYGVSFVTRLIVHGGLGYDRLFIQSSQQEIMQRDAVEKIRALMPAFGELASEHRFRLVFVFHPMTGDILTGSYDYGFDSLIGEARQRGLDVIDVRARWPAAADGSANWAARWYWPTDGHHNAEGYAIFGAAVVDGLIELGFDE